MTAAENKPDTIESLQKQVADLTHQVLCYGEEAAEQGALLASLPEVEGHDARWLCEQLAELRSTQSLPHRLHAIDELTGWLDKQRGAV